jgi:hypothetical protein
MAKPIKHTPIVKGNDAINFLSQLQENKHRKVDRSTIISIRQDAQKLKSALKN